MWFKKKREDVVHIGSDVGKKFWVKYFNNGNFTNKALLYMYL